MSRKKSLLIIRRKLGKTGLELPVVSMGVMRSDNPALVKAAMDAGIRHFDTAHVYQGGKNETMLGEVFKDYPRDSFTLATKIPLDDVDRHTGTIGPEATKESILAKMDISLQRLQMDYVDILYLHGVAHRAGGSSSRIPGSSADAQATGQNQVCRGFHTPVTNLR